MPQVKPNRFLRWLARCTLRLGGWKVTGTLPDVPKVVFIIAPHSSNWDGFWGMAAKIALGMQVKVLGKASLFWWPLSPLLRALLFGVQTTQFRPVGRLGGHACLGHAQPRLDEGGQSIARVLAVTVLGTETLCIDDQHAFAGHAPVAAGQQARAQRLGQRRRAGHVEAQLDGGGDLVDVLATGAAGAHEPLDEFRIRNRQVRADGDWPVAHGRHCKGRTAGRVTATCVDVADNVLNYGLMTPSQVFSGVHATQDAPPCP